MAKTRKIIKNRSISAKEGWKNVAGKKQRSDDKLAAAREGQFMVFFCFLNYTQKL